MPNAAAIPSGCPFHTRCFKARPICSEQAPAFEEKRPGHWAACHFADVPGATRPDDIRAPLQAFPGQA